MVIKIDSHKGDSIDFPGDFKQDITGWEIRCEIWDSQSPSLSIKKGNNQVPSGDSTQIEITDIAAGTFTVHILPGETTNFDGDIRIEIEVIANGKQETVLSDFLVLKEEQITWGAVS